MKLPPNRERGRFDVKMTPMIDVVFLLLIFFVCTASFQQLEEVLPTHLRAETTGASSAELDPELLELEDVIVKVVRRDGRTAWVLNEQPYATLAELRGVLEQLAAIRADLPVILDVQGQVPIGEVIDVYDVCRLAGFEMVQFAASANT